MKLKHHLEPFVNDCKAILEATGASLKLADHGESGLKFMHLLHHMVAKNRAYGDDHPAFAQGAWKRLLPYDGRDYCWLYDDDCNDDHVATMLREAKKRLEAMGF